MEKFFICLPILFLFAGKSVYAEEVAHDYVEGKIKFLSINGGLDTRNPGTSCLQLYDAPNTRSCEDGYFAIPNNNKELIAAALTAKAIGSTIKIYYFFDETKKEVNQAGIEVFKPKMHCPGMATTRCAINTITIK